MAHFQQESAEKLGKHVKPYCSDYDDVVEKLSVGAHFRVSYLCENMFIEETELEITMEKVKK